MAKKTSLAPGNLNILLADDDPADCLLFKEALEELSLTTTLAIVHDGEELMKLLKKRGTKLPDILFLDINMPRKNGFASLSEIKNHPRLQKLPVIILSTSGAQEMENLKVDQTFKDAAHYYIRKPNNFTELKSVILNILKSVQAHSMSLPYVKEKFILTGDLNSTPDEIKVTSRKKAH